MRGRPRKREYRNLPDHLFFDKSKNSYRFLMVNGTKKTLGHDKNLAIAIAREYNHIMRPELIVSISNLLKESGGQHGETLFFCTHVDHLVNRIITDEKPATDTISGWKNDAVRIKEFFTNIPACNIELEHVNGFIQTYHSDASANVQNRKVSFLKKLFSYAVDESLMLDNPATRKKMRRTAGKVRRRLSLEAFILIRSNAPIWLKTAMDLALQTTQARLEVSRIKYSIRVPKQNECGCVWYPVDKNGIFGMLYIHRQKVQHKEASHVAIPIGSALKAIIDSSRDSVASPYIVHRRHQKIGHKISKDVCHPTQVAPDYLSRSFSDLRDHLGIDSDFALNERPTFHEIRALAAHLFSKQGLDPQARMAHSDAKSTKIYTQNHVEWVEVPHGEINYG